MSNFYVYLHRFEWCQVTSKEITSNNYRIDNLLRGHEYRFRVMAHNVYGLGPPGCETDFLLMTGQCALINEDVVICFFTDENNM